MEGILLVDKPTGWTSFDVVNFVRRKIAIEQNVKPSRIKVGHTGTLDPLASGLLVLLIGKQYTQKAMSLTKVDKYYEAQAKLGEVSASFDTETTAQFYSDIKPELQQVESTLKSFCGPGEQVPPIYSALKVGGQRAYKLARSGSELQLQARAIEIKSVELQSYEYPFLYFNCLVSSGTYVRSLVNDLGLKLGSGALMTDLRRTAVGDFHIDQAISVENITINKIKAALRT